MTYRLLRVGVEHIPTGAVLRPDSGQPWLEYLAWLASGNEPLPYEPPQPTPEEALEAAKAERKEYIRRRWADAEASGFSWNGATYASDQRSLNRLWPSIVRAATDPGAFSLPWNRADGSQVVLSKTQLIDFNKSLQGHLQAQHERAMLRLSAIDDATSIAGVLAVEW